jgi:hypothetical protein
MVIFHSYVSLPEGTPYGWNMEPPNPIFGRKLRGIEPREMPSLPRVAANVVMSYHDVMFPVRIYHLLQ